MPLKSFGCSICGEQAPRALREHGKLRKRMLWLQRHRKSRHPSLHRRSITKSLKSRANKMGRRQ